MIYQVPAAKNKLQHTVDNVSRRASDPVDEQDNIGYGIITAVDNETSQVKVRLWINSKRGGYIDVPGFWPLANPLSQIHMLWGQLRPGLTCRMHWKGKFTPTNTAGRMIIEVIGDEDLDFLKKTPKPNIINTGPYKLISGGLLG